MTQWLIVYDDNTKEIVEAEDLYEIHRVVDSIYVTAVIKLNNIQNGYVQKDY